MNREAGAYFDELRQNGMFDLFDRKGKVAYDGFCVELTDYNTDFIFGHFAGDQTDLEVLVHEFGHALAACRARRNPRVPYLLRSGTQEIAGDAFQVDGAAHAPLSGAVLHSGGPA